MKIPKAIMNKQVAQVLIVFSLLFFSLQACSQIVNIEDKRTSHADTAAWYGQVRLGINLVENGSSILNVNGAATIERIKGKHWFLSLTNFNFVQVNDQDFINDGFQHFRYNYKINNWLVYEAFSQAQYNEKLNLQFRGLAGTGLRFPVLSKEKYDLNFGLTYMYEYNQETNPEAEFHDNRISTYLSFSLMLTKYAELVGTTYYQPVIDDFSDLRLSSQSSLVINFTKNLAFSTSFNITYDSRVPENVANTIYSIRNGIRFNF